MAHVHCRAREGEFSEQEMVTGQQALIAKRDELQEQKKEGGMGLGERKEPDLLPSCC